ncbi:putative Dilute domain-containing protein [Helianthus annuus]|uniref:Dilute domain-containing protein n=1 Tax=Helianthus annuus TaxID=4232 RepID=A0A251V6J3_HELAN|nr:putative Dilute domain-containing protein [Helianthus annuus]KAJ0592880.1 putative Dilute domain-containing protein [Helianthus annuus]KAJ0600570.1 putative Dilute domain-containing protein [Helianthus annuus]KAJ0607882.1 putative Dilute domain-containing protein [Helianthus annuus]KAJ0767946.1 putative Dilute domain-containing protein [Helianthus annuus]
MGNTSRHDCRNWNSGAIKQLKRLIYGLDPSYAGSAWDEIKHIRQAIGFLVIHQKPKKALDEITHDLCPVSFSSHILSRKSLIQY